MNILRLITLLSTVLIASALPPSTDGASAQYCAPLDSNCIEEQKECGMFDPYCNETTDDCATWNSSCNSKTPRNSFPNRQQNKVVEYTVKVTCYLVIEDTVDGTSGYCNPSSGANLNYCVKDSRHRSNQYTMTFRCSDGEPDVMARHATDELKVRSISSVSTFSEPYWLLCDKGMSGYSRDKKCYDTDFSDASDWSNSCRVDSRIDEERDGKDTFVWLVCP